MVHQYGIMLAKYAVSEGAVERALYPARSGGMDMRITAKEYMRARARTYRLQRLIGSAVGMGKDTDGRDMQKVVWWIDRMNHGRQMRQYTGVCAAYT